MSFSSVSNRYSPAFLSPRVPARPSAPAPVAQRPAGTATSAGTQRLQTPQDCFTPAGGRQGLEQLQSLIGRSLQDIAQELRALVGTADTSATQTDRMGDARAARLGESSFAPAAQRRAPVDLNPAASQPVAGAQTRQGITIDPSDDGIGHAPADGMGLDAEDGASTAATDELHEVDARLEHAPFGEVPYISQYNPAGAENGYTNGKANCGPTSMAMIARSFGYGSDLTDAQLINHLGKAGGTTSDGTDIGGILKMAKKMGLPGEQRGPGADVEWIANQLRDGKLVVANGDIYELGNKANPAKTSGHYVVVESVDEKGTFQVKAPANETVSTVSPEELERFINENPNGGYQFAIG